MKKICNVLSFSSLCSTGIPIDRARPLATSIFFVKIKTKIARPLGFELKSADPSQIFNLVPWPLSHEDISGSDSLIIHEYW